MTCIPRFFRQRAAFPVILGALSLAVAIPGCAPTTPAVSPVTEPPSVTPPKPVDPKRAEAQQLLDELALSVLRATGRVVPEMFVFESATAPIQLSPRGQELIHGRELELVETALRAVNKNELAMKTLAKGMDRAKEYCSKNNCSDENYKIELVAIEPPLANSDVLVRGAFSGDPKAICVASQLFNLLYRIAAPEPSPTCAKAEAYVVMSVRSQFAEGFLAFNCVDGTNLGDTPADTCCYLLDDDGFHWGKVKDKPRKRCNLL